MPAHRVTIRHFTDPGCPWAFSAERQRRQLEWLYGDQLEWSLVMVGLARTVEEQEAKGFTPERLSAGLRQLQARFAMPIDWSPRDHVPATRPACLAVVAARLRAPEREAALLRRLRVLAMGGGQLDDEGLIRRAAAEAGLDGGELVAWTGEDDVAAALEADMRAARSPTPAALALDHKLGGPVDERRYTCPSYVMTADGVSLDLPGFQPVEAYEAAVANLAPDLRRRESPDTAVEVLEWAGEPIATAEVAAVCGRELPDVRTELAHAGARFEPAGADGYWTAG